MLQKVRKSNEASIVNNAFGLFIYLIHLNVTNYNAYNSAVRQRVSPLLLKMPAGMKNMWPSKFFGHGMSILMKNSVISAHQLSSTLRNKNIRLVVIAFLFFLYTISPKDNTILG